MAEAGPAPCRWQAAWAVSAALTAAARSVLETGEFDYAWNLQLAPDVIAKMAEGGKMDVLHFTDKQYENIVSYRG